MALFVLRKLILQTCMRSHSMRLDIWFLVGPFVYFHTLCVQTAKALARLHRCSGLPEPLLVAYVIGTIISWAGSIILTKGLSETEHDKTNKMMCAQPIHRSVWASARSHQSSPSAWKSYPLSAQRCLWSDRAKGRLIWVFAGCTTHFAGFVVLRLISNSVLRPIEDYFISNEPNQPDRGLNVYQLN